MIVCHHIEYKKIHVKMLMIQSSNYYSNSLHIPPFTCLWNKKIKSNKFNFFDVYCFNFWNIIWTKILQKNVFQFNCVWNFKQVHFFFLIWRNGFDGFVNSRFGGQFWWMLLLWLGWFTLFDQGRNWSWNFLLICFQIVSNGGISGRFLMKINSKRGLSYGGPHIYIFTNFYRV